MYCHRCGAEVHGLYCSHCGTRVLSDSAATPPERGWIDEIRYDVLLRHSDVRELIARYAARSPQRMSAEDFLELCDKAFVPVAGVSLVKVCAMTQPISAALGVKTGKRRKEFFTVPAGKVLVAVLCSLARHGQPIDTVEQGIDGCLLKAVLPSDIWSFEGEFLVTVQRLDQGTSVEAATHVRGQLFDWGKSGRAIRTLFNDISDLAVRTT